MKPIRQTVVVAAAACLMGSAGATGMNVVLDGMFSNVTAPDVVSTQLRGTISGGGAYVRTPISGIQVFSLDPPRLSAGCGGIDLYLGSFSFITAEKLTQFIRNVAQNAAPLAFKMALDSMFPQLGGVLDKFQHMAQMMNDSQRNSCQLAKGLLDGAKNSEELFNNMGQAISGGVATVKGWMSDFTESITSSQENPSKNLARARNETTTDGRKTIPNLGNITWNALQSRKYSATTYKITDDPAMGQQIILSLLGTQVNKEGASESAEPISTSYPPQRLRLKDLFRPATGLTGVKEVPIWSCSSNTSECLSPAASTFTTGGVEGYVRKFMYGTETATSPLDGSIVYKLGNCTSGNCALTASQLSFLNSLGKIQAVSMLIRSQNVPTVVGIISPSLVDMMTDELSVLYGRSLIAMAQGVYAGSDLSKPEAFHETVRQMMADVDEVDARTRENIIKTQQIAGFIDTSVRTNGAALRYRPVR